ncbi:MAG: type V CRISPR-associated endonuclease Cas1 [bacterium]
MLSLNDFREKQILFIHNSADIESKIKFQNDNIIYVKDDKTTDKLSCYKILAIFIIGDISFTTVLIKNAIKFGISIFLMKPNFEVYATIESKADGNFLLRNKQYKASNEFYIAKKLVKNKLFNQFELMLKEKYLDKERCTNKKNEIVEKIKNAKDEKELLGIEGSASKNFFGGYFEELGWRGRSPRTKVDEYNLLLDIGYTFIFNYVDALLRLYGFDVYKGCYHKLFFKRKSLSCDIVEPFRCVIDKQLLKSFRLGQIDKKDFKFINGQYSLNYEKSKKYSEIFLKGILRYKENIFDYVYEYYRFIMDDSRNFPFFEIK